MHRLDVSADVAETNSEVDEYANRVINLYIPSIERSIDFEAWIVVERFADHGLHFLPGAALLDPRYLEPSALTQPDDALRKVGAALCEGDYARQQPAALARRINDWVNNALSYEHGVTDIHTTAAQTLSLYGRQGTRRVHVLPARFRTHTEQTGMWARLAQSIMGRPRTFLIGAGAVMVAAALPIFALKLTPGSAGGGVPTSPESIRGFLVLREAVGPGAVAPAQVVIDSGRPNGATQPPVQAAATRLITELRHDPEVARVTFSPAPPFVDATGRYLHVIVAGRHDYGDPPAQAFARRLRGALIPNAHFPKGAHALAGGSPPQGIDFLDRAYGAFPWLVIAVLILTFVVLMRAFRSVLLPLKAVLLNLLSVGATYGMLVLVFKWGLGADLVGFYHYSQVEGWIPIFLFAILFGLSMDYEVFLVTRMREVWDATGDNETAVVEGLERTGRIVTAAALIMVAAFSGLAAGSLVGLQELGVGLAVAILLDATVVRALLVPSLMALFGRYNWWLPAWLARLVLVPASPLVGPRQQAALRPTCD